MKAKQLKVLTLVFTIAALSACVSTVPVYNVSSKSCPANREGFYYALPKTVITVDVTVSLTTIEAGKYQDLSKDMLGISVTPGKEFKIEETKFGSYSDVDTSQWYFVDLSKNGLFKKVSITTTTSENGVISAATAEVENKTIDYALETIDFATTIAAKFIPFTSPAPSATFSPEMFGQTKTKSSITTEPLTMTRRDSAIIVARQIAKLESERTDLITNTNSQISAEALQLMLKEIDAQIQSLLSHFLGTKTVKKTTLHFESSEVKELTLFNFSASHGLSGLPAHMNIHPAFRSTNTGGDPIILRFLAATSVPQALRAAAPDSKKSGFYYRIPASTTVQLWKSTVVLNQTNLLISQSGLVSSLPAKAGGGKTKYELKYDPKSGALLEIKVNGEPISAETVNKITETGNTIMETIKPDELGELEKERKILEEKQKIKELLEEKNN